MVHSVSNRCFLMQLMNENLFNPPETEEKGNRHMGFSARTRFGRVASPFLSQRTTDTTESSSPDLET